jgi:hypothetical protein
MEGTANGASSRTSVDPDAETANEPPSFPGQGRLLFLAAFVSAFMGDAPETFKIGHCDCPPLSESDSVVQIKSPEG